MITAHDLVTREHILEGARQHVMHARLAVRSRRSLVKDIFGRTLALLGVNRVEELGPEYLRFDPDWQVSPSRKGMGDEVGGMRKLAE